MLTLSKFQLGVLTVLCSIFLLENRAPAQVKPDVVLAYQPAQADIDIETPTPAEVAECELKVEGEGKKSGWALYGPKGQILRRFMDTDGDSKVDEFKYFKFGLEVYRDIDTDGDNKINESRWLNTHGTRWGVDANQDGTIDNWRLISAEEATREAILALATGNIARLQAVFIDAADVESLGLSHPVAEKYLSNRSEIEKQVAEILQMSKTISRGTEWVRFDSSMLMPNLIPADAGKSKSDLLVYENVMAIVKNGEDNGFVLIGEMVRVGNAWKVTQCPRPLEGDQFEIGEGGILLQPTLPSAGPGNLAGISEEMKELVDKLRELDDKAPQIESSREELSKFNVERANLLKQLGDLSVSPEDKSFWQRQRLELIAAATQMNTYPRGLEEIQAAITQLRSSQADKELLSFATYQNLLMTYAIQLEAAGQNEREDVQRNWLASLESFTEEFSQTPEAADAMLKLAISQEVDGKLKEARDWYNKLVADYAPTPAGQRARGALTRLAMKGQPLTLAGPVFGTDKTLDLAAYRGKVTAVLFWATWCKPCTEDLPQLQQLHKEFQPRGFEVVGVNLDSPDADIAGFLRNYRVTWPSIHEEGGLESRPAIDFGIFSLPTMFVVDRSGKVVSNNASITDLKTLVPQLVGSAP